MAGKKHILLSAEAMFGAETNTCYDRHLGPNNYFWKYLVRKEGGSLPALVPDTITSGEGDFPSTWVYTGPDGLLHATKQFTLRDVVNKFCSWASPDQLVAIIKKPEYVRLDVQLVSCKRLQPLFNQVMQNNQENIVFQKYVKSSGTRASLCRTLFRSQGISQSWVISNKNQYYRAEKKSKEEKEEKEQQNLTASIHPGKVNLVHLTKGQSLRKTLPVLRAIKKFVFDRHQLELTEIAADFIRDQSGQYWLTGVKHFMLARPLQAEGRLLRPHCAKQIYKKTRNCSYCQKSYYEFQLSCRMTTKMIIELDRFIERQGKSFAWLSRSKVDHLERESLYEQTLVCERCYKLYRSAKDLFALELEFAAKLGIPVGNQDAVAVPKCQEGVQFKREQVMTTLKRQKLPRRIEIEEGFQVNLEGGVPLRSLSSKNSMFRFRMLLFFQGIREISSLDHSISYYLEYSLFAQRIRYKIQTSESRRDLLLNRFRLFYVFAPSHRALADYFQQLKFLHLAILVEDPAKPRQKDCFATLDIQLADFQKVRMREFYKMFNLRNSSWGWGLSASIGLVPSGEVEVAGTRLLPHYGVYIPPNDYFAYEPLPADWQTLINNYNPERLLKQKSSESGLAFGLHRSSSVRCEFVRGFKGVKRSQQKFKVNQ